MNCTEIVCWLDMTTVYFPDLLIGSGSFMALREVWQANKV